MSSDEKWTAEVRSALMTLDGMARTSYQQQALRTIKDALMVGSILDAEGDGGAVGEALKLQAQIHAQEARTANATIAEIYKLCTGSTGEPGNWHGAEPVRALIAERDALLAAATYPARSGVVSDEDVRDAAIKRISAQLQAQGEILFDKWWLVEAINKRADEILREGERHDR